MAVLDEIVDNTTFDDSPVLVVDLDSAWLDALPKPIPGFTRDPRKRPAKRTS